MDLASSSSGGTAILFPAMQQVHSLSHPSSILHRATGDLFFFLPLHCYSSPIRLWRSTVWRRAWEEKSQSEGRDEMRCDGLACGGKEGTMQIKYASPIRNQQTRWPCCYGNTPSAVEYWAWLCWCKCYKVLNRVWSQTIWHRLVWNVRCFSYRCACCTLVFSFSHRFTILAVKYR